MFDSNDIRALRHRLIEIKGIFRVGFLPIIFLEDKEDLYSASGMPYEISRPFENGNKEVLKIAISDLQQSCLSYKFVSILRDAVDFRLTDNHFPNLQTAYNFTMWERNAILLRDVSLVPSISPHPYRISTHHLYFQDTRSLYSSGFFMETFELTLWICFMSSFLVILACCWIWNKLTVKYKRGEYLPVIALISSIMGNSTNFLSTERTSGRILLLTFFILLIFFYGAFGAFLDVLLTIKRIILPFKTIDGMIMRNDYTICMSTVNSIWKSIVAKKYEVGGKIIINSDQCPNASATTLRWAEDYTYQCTNKKLTFFFDPIVISFERFLIERCNLIKFPGNYFNTQASFITGLDFSLKEILNQKIIKIRTSGNIDYLLNTMFFKEKGHLFMGPHLEHTHSEIVFEQCKLIIFILLFGMLVSVVILAFEIQWMKRSKNKSPEKL